MSNELTAADLVISDLGICKVPSPVASLLGERAMHFVGEADKVLLDDRLSSLGTHHGLIAEMPAFELAGPRNRIFWEPSAVKAGIVTCGGLCPGLNNVVRGIVLELWHSYGVRSIVGFRYGYEGLVPRFGHDPLALDPRSVSRIHHQGGTVLGSSRGKQEAVETVDYLEKLGINQLYVVGGDGTIRGAMAIVEEAKKRNLKLGVIGVPKTIDNDIQFIDRSFGFETAFTEAVTVIKSANVEANGARGGVGLVKLMGRHSGFIACHAALASTDVNIVLIPEVPVALAGEKGLLAYLEKRIERSGHAVIVVAEGAGQALLAAGDGARDASGNLKLQDVGTWLRDTIVGHFKARKIELNLKYLDPSYHIRSVPASPSDSVFCWNLARNSVHAAMAGNTAMLIGRWHGRFVHVPMAVATRQRKEVDPTGDLWMSVIEGTGQPKAFA
ncbi:MAG: ATP-dependent 6-phosphofructokinase [Planctomycetes bacterium]|nr:ATP-dependent 6-phosphofructokinase [Planctomycetota bacterium]